MADTTDLLQPAPRTSSDGVVHGVIVHAILLGKRADRAPFGNECSSRADLIGSQFRPDVTFAPGVGVVDHPVGQVVGVCGPTQVFSCPAGRASTPMGDFHPFRSRTMPSFTGNRVHGSAPTVDMERTVASSEMAVRPVSTSRTRRHHESLKVGECFALRGALQWGVGRSKALPAAVVHGTPPPGRTRDTCRAGTTINGALHHD